ncbi:hypothetical protein K491DRAFT_632544 [Lophiostoma macrostomum CBS 122681]|uniref:Metallothionein n=1 Tax=Lophiostoma macrostomum CBS 122681 TaxID=1314788 RepID=A0A6A6T2A0_9PLEO|nr:hypothetical protein K491DRAFT_632544 [Lophiostoma macrostomum CBS 122681]
MKLSSIIALLSASLVLASPATTSLKRSTKLVRDANEHQVATPCVECPCTGFGSGCTCVPNGCCCT